jgi:hypothetical protein
MKLFIAVNTEMAEGVVARGFVGSAGRPTILYGTDDRGDFLLNPDGSRIESFRGDICEFRDIPPRGLTLSRTTEVTSKVDNDRIEITMDGGPVLADDLGDFILSIEVPDDFALEREAHEDPPSGWTSVSSGSRRRTLTNTETRLRFTTVMTARRSAPI